MARMTDIKLTLDIEPVVKLSCANTDCRFSLLREGWLCCGLKYIGIDENGRCMQYEPREAESSVRQAGEEKGGFVEMNEEMGGKGQPLGLLDILEPIRQHDQKRLCEIATELKQTDGEHWAVGEMLERAVQFLALESAMC